MESEGNVNLSILEDVVASLKKELFEKLESISLKPSKGNAISSDVPLMNSTVKTPSQFEFAYNGGMWFLPKSFQFPEGATRYTGWKKWLVGAIHVDGMQHWQVKPYRRFSGRDISSKDQQNIFKNEWKPIFSKMMEAPGLIVPSNVKDITEDIVQATYNIATEFLRTKYEYIFLKPEGVTEAYTLGTWSFKIKLSEVKKHGTAADKARLPAETSANQQHKSKRTIIPGTGRRPSKIARKGTGRKSALMILTMKYV